MKNLKAFILYSALQLILFSIVFAQEQKPELLVQKEHSTMVSSLALSADGRILTSGEANGTVKMWDLQTGANVRSIELYSELGDEIAVSAAGRSLFTASVDECALWDLQDGKKLQSFKCGEGENYFSIRKFNFTNSVLAVSNQDSFELVDFKNKKDMKLAGIDGLAIHALEFSADGKTLAASIYSAADDDSEKTGNAAKKQSKLDNTGFGINIYNVASGQLLRKIEGLPGAVKNLAFTSGGQFLAGSGDRFDKKETFLKLWNAASGTQITDYQLAADELQVALTKNCAVVSRGDSNLKILHFDKGMFAPQTLNGKAEVVTAAVLSSDGGTLVTGDIIGGLKIWNLKDGGEAQLLGADIRSVSKVAVDRDSRQLFFAQKVYSFSKEEDNIYFESELKIFDFESGVRNKVFPKISNGIAVADFAFGKDGKSFAVSGKSTSETRVKSSLINLGAFLGDTDGKQSVVLKALDGEVFTSLAFSPDGKLVATGSTQQGTNADGYIGGGSETRAIKIWDAATGKLVRRLVGEYTGTVGAENTFVNFSPDGKTILSIGSDEIARLWDVESGKQTKVFDRHSDDFAEFYNFSPNGTMLAFASFGSDSERRKIKLLNIADGKIIHTFAGHTGETSSVAFTADGKILISSSDDGSVKFWDVASEKEIADLILIGADDWVVTTPEGLFDGTPAGWKALLWRFENNPFNTAPVEAFFKEFYYPNLLQETLAGRKPLAPARDLASVDIRSPEIKITEIDGEQTNAKTSFSANNAKIKVKIEITDNAGKAARPNFPASSGAKDLRLFRNGSLVKLWNKDVFDLHEISGCKQTAATSDTPRKAVCEAEVQIMAGKNEFTAYAFNHDNVKSNNTVAEIKGANSLKRSGTLYVLAIGVNEYADATHNLKYAVADADAISAELAAQQTKLLQKQYGNTEIIKLTDGRATQENIIFALEKFSAKGFDESLLTKTAREVKSELAKIKPAKPEDALVVYFAGHGTASKDRFYLIPHDGFPASDAVDNRYEKLYEQSVSDEILEFELENVDAGKILLIIDACNSGQALESEEKRRGPMNSKGLAQLAYEKGIYILTAAQSQQAALEVSKFGHGLLTFSLLEGMKNAEKNSNGTIFERKWLDYAVQKVPQLQLDKMQKRDAEIKKDPATRSIGIIFLNGDNKKLPPEKRGLQSPRIFYRRELETNPLVVAKP